MRGNVPYHPKELGYSAPDEQIIVTGLLGVLVMVGCTIATMIVTIIAFPFVLFGVAEYVSGSVTNWRVRWVRR